MNPKFWISAVFLAVLSLALGYLVHGWILAPDYERLPSLFRGEADAQAFFPFMIVAHLLVGVGFTWIYLKGREAKPFLQQGVRFGLAVAVLTTIPKYLIYFAVQPMPGNIVVKQIVFDTIAMVIMGVACAWINQDRRRA
ncbi:MAG TPA: hypothetical protein VET86_16470 [Casimicrobiaceae bacterium]|nr:hypothetical protein [Casimicrobiaceae bacterium]